MALLEHFLSDHGNEIKYTSENKQNQKSLISSFTILGREIQLQSREKMKKSEER